MKSITLCFLLMCASGTVAHAFQNESPPPAVSEERGVLSQTVTVVGQKMKKPKRVSVRAAEDALLLRDGARNNTIIVLKQPDYSDINLVEAINNRRIYQGYIVDFSVPDVDCQYNPILTLIVDGVKQEIVERDYKFKLERPTATAVVGFVANRNRATADDSYTGRIFIYIGNIRRDNHGKYYSADNDVNEMYDISNSEDSAYVKPKNARYFVCISEKINDPVPPINAVQQFGGFDRVLARSTSSNLNADIINVFSKFNADIDKATNATFAAVQESGVRPADLGVYDRNDVQRDYPSANFANDRNWITCSSRVSAQINNSSMVCPSFTIGKVSRISGIGPIFTPGPLPMYNDIVKVNILSMPQEADVFVAEIFRDRTNVSRTMPGSLMSSVRLEKDGYQSCTAQDMKRKLVNRDRNEWLLFCKLKKL